MNVRALILLAAFLLPLPMMADTTYSYTGNHFTVDLTYFGGEVYGPAPPYTTSDSVSGWFTLDTPLPSTSSGKFQVSPGSFWVVPTAFSFTDGQQTISSSNGASIDFYIGADGSGNIADWQIEVATDSYFGSAPNGWGTIYAQGGPWFPLGGGDWGYLATTTLVWNASDPLSTDGWYGPFDYKGISETPGRWTETATSTTPEPASFILLMTGLAAMTGLARRKLMRP